MQIFWQKNCTCPVCGKQFQAVRLFSEAIKVKERDTDLKPAYEGINALLFQPITCTHCYYTAFEDDFEKPVTEKKRIQELCDRIKNSLSIDLSENRSLKDGAMIFAIAAAVYTLTEKHLKAAEAYLKLSWIHRDMHSKDENNALEQAMKCFLESYKNDELAPEKEIMVIFYLGEINLRLGNKKEAVRWFSSLIQKFGNTNSIYVKLARKEWQQAAAGKRGL